MMDMTNFKTWLDTERGRATTLQKKLGVNATTISNVKHERRLMPTRWMKIIVRMAKNTLTYEQLVLRRDHVQAALANQKTT